MRFQFDALDTFVYYDISNKASDTVFANLSEIKHEAQTKGWVMAKSLSARIADLETELHGARNRAAFLAVRDEVKQAMGDGWSVKAIWRTLYRDQKIAFGYEAFRKYVIGLIAGHRLKERRSLVVGNQKLNNKIKDAFAQVDKESKSEIRGFHFNPIPNKDELY